MPYPSQDSLRNMLLRALPPDGFALLRPHLEPLDHVRGQVLVEPNAPIAEVHFPETGVGSLINATSDGRRLEVGLVGRDGMTGTSLVLGADRTPLECVIQVDGYGHRVAADVLCGAMAQGPAVHGVLLLHVQAFSLQVSQTALSNNSYPLEARLARWLLLCHDRIDGDELGLTHEFMAVMLGVHRPGVTLATHVLEGAGAIRARRGTITVLDREKLEGLAGDGYGPAEAEYERLIAPLRKRAGA